MRVRVLGPVCVTRADGTEARLSGSKRKALLAILALAGGRAVSADVLVESLRGDAAPPGALATLQSHVSQLRKQLGGPSTIRSQPPGYALSCRAEDVDALEFERLCRDGHRAPAGSEQAARSFADALALWRGRPFADVTGVPALEAEAARLEQARLQAAVALAEGELGRGRHGELLPQLEALARDHPLDERIARLLIVALYRCGRQVDALRAYQAVREVLAEELGLEPGPELQSLEAAVLRQDRDLEPPPRRAEAAVPARARLPTPPTPFVGRSREVEELDGLLQRARLVTITGTGGSGKTRLATEVANAVAARFRHGVALAELSAVTGGQVPRHVADALGLDVQPDADLVATIRDALEPRHLLLILDNCEHVIDEASLLAEGLVSSCPSVRILATSREPLDAPGEHLFPLLPLGTPAPELSDPAELASFPSLQLLVQLAQQSSATFSCGTDAEVRAVADICRRLDGLPLALELAAAVLRTLSLAEVVERLEDRLDLLSRGHRSAPPRHRSLRAAIEWSHQLLDDQERASLRRLAVFAGGAALDDALAVAGDPTRHHLASLGALVDKSLVVRAEREGRTRLSLHESIRQFAMEQLEAANEVEPTRRRHAEAMARLAAAAGHRLRGPEQEVWLARLEREHENLRVALEWAAHADPALFTQLCRDLWWFWFRTARTTEGRAWLARALDQSRPGEPAGASPDLLAPAAYLAWQQDDFETAHRLVGHALEAGATGGPRALALGVRARIAGDQGDFATAVAAAREGVELYEEVGDPWAVAWSRRCLASALLFSGDLATSRGIARASTDGFREVGDAWGLAGSLDLQALIAVREGRPSEALELAAEAVVEHRRLGDRSGTRQALYHLALIAAEAQQPERAVAAATESLELARENGFRLGAAHALTLLARLALEAGDRQRAEACAVEAVDLASQMGDGATEAEARQLLGLS